jgi:uncharacterized protein YggE
MAELIPMDQIVVTWLAAAFPNARVCTETPANLLDVLPVIQVQTIGGTDPVPNLDVATVDVDVFAAGAVAAEQLAEQVRDSLRTNMQGKQVAGAFVAAVSTVNRPRYVYYSDDATLRRYVATYRVAARTH